MNNYSDIIFLMGAMVIFSILSRNAIHTFLQMDSASTQAEVEFEAIALGQDIIDEVKWTNNVSELNALVNEYNNQSVTISFGSEDEFQIDYLLALSAKDTSISGSQATNKVVDLQVFSEYLPEYMQVKMKYLKSYVN